MEIQLLSDIFKLFGVSVVVLFVATRFRVPTIVAFLVTGVVAGPHGLGLVGHTHAVEVMAEVGVVLLLFTIGMEFSIEELMRIKKPVLLGGSLQVVFTFVGTVIAAKFAGLTLAQGIFTGFLLSLSSTAIALKLIQSRGEMDAPHGKASLGILIFQDIAVVPMMLMVPMLAGTGGDLTESLWGMAKGMGIVAVVFIAAKWVVPRLLYQIAKTRDKEFFLLSIVVICLGVAAATNAVGLSLSLGAFLAGLIVSESEYSHHAIGNILPFKNVFTTIFFVSIGMLLDLHALLEQPVLIAGLTLGVLALKTGVAGLATMFLGYPLRTVLLVGLALSQVGEFSFVIAKSGLDVGLIDQSGYQTFLAVSVLTMVLTPLMLWAAPKFLHIANRLPLPERFKNGQVVDQHHPASKNRGHLVIIGFGINGRNLAHAAKASGVSYDVLEMNPDVVSDQRSKGEPIWYGDACQEAVLEHVGVPHAKVIVVAVSDPVATRRITKVSREMAPDARIIVRTRYIQELKVLYELGASEVVPEEFETSIQIFTRTLQEFGKPQEHIDFLVQQTRKSNYEIFREYAKHDIGLFDRIQNILLKD